jgi:hypothetical protein
VRRPVRVNGCRVSRRLIPQELCMKRTAFPFVPGAQGMVRLCLTFTIRNAFA